MLTALIFLVALTLIGIGVFSTTVSEERIARNFRDKEIALQAAEAGLNEAKFLITGSYDSTNPPTTKPTPLSEEKCYAGTPTGYSCDPNINPLTTDLITTATGAPLGTLSTMGSPTVIGLFAQPRYLVVWQSASVCGASSSGFCFLIISQAQGRLTGTRVNLVELFTY